MCGLNYEGDRRMRAVFDEVVEFPRVARESFMAGFYGKVESLVMFGSVADDQFVASVEVWLAKIKERIEKGPK